VTEAILCCVINK